jgi:N-6 DNA Methylase
MKSINTTTQLDLFINENKQGAPQNIQVANSTGSGDKASQASATPAATPRRAEFLADPTSIPECDWSEFIRTNGRVPMLADAKRPWHYRGWLLYYRLLAEAHPEIAPRWEYWLRTKIAKRMLDEPIPVVNFDSCASRDCSKMLEGWLQTVDRLHSHWSPMDTLLDWFLWGLGVSSDLPKTSEALNSELYRGVNLGPLLLRPYDYLGEWIANQKGKWNPHAFFPTPHSVVEMMVQMTMNVGGEDQRSKMVMEPALGSGRMLLHASNYSLRLYGVDIDPLLVKVALTNGALYAPWMVRPFPSSFFPIDPRVSGVDP